MIPGVVAVSWVPAPLTSGLLVSVIADGTTNRDYSAYDPSNITHPLWQSFFSETIDIGVFGFIQSPRAVVDTGVLPTRTLSFDPAREYLLGAYNKSWTGDLCELDLEFLAEDGSVICALRTAADGTYSSGLWYGPNLGQLTKTAKTGYGGTNGQLTFAGNHMTYTCNCGLSNGDNLSFTFAADTPSITQLRVSGARAKSTYTGGNGGAATVMLKLLAP